MDAGVGLEAEIGAIGGVEDDKFVAEDASILADFDECVKFCEAMPGLAVFAPAIGTAHGFYAGSRKSPMRFWSASPAPSISRSPCMAERG